MDLNLILKVSLKDEHTQTYIYTFNILRNMKQ